MPPVASIEFFVFAVLQVPMSPESGLSMLFEDLVSFVLGLALLLVLAYVAYRAWQPVAAYVSHDGE